MSMRLWPRQVLDGVSIDQATGVLQQEVIPNPRYLRGTMREVFTFLYDFLPGGQAIALSSMEVASPIGSWPILWPLPWRLTPLGFAASAGRI